jgi:murein hydrolase activator
MKQFFAVLFISVLVCSSPLMAQEKKNPPKKESVQEVEKRLAAERKRKEELDKKVADLAKDVKGLKTNLISTTEKVATSQKNLSELEKKLDELNTQKTDIVQSLDKDRASLANLITALERIRRLPPSTLIARPGAPLQTAQAVTVLSSIVPELNTRAAALKEKLASLQEIESDLQENRTKIATQTEKLQTEKEKMDALMKAREKAFAKTQSDLKSQEQTVASLSRQAKNLRDLIEKLETQKRADAKKRARAKQKQDSAEGRRRAPTLDDNIDENLPALGSTRAPLPGKVLTSFGEKDNIGAISEGVRIESRPGAVVVAPMGGIVRYAGPFKTYGTIILLEHKNNYHSLVAGLGRINARVGQTVDAGEPLGSLGGDGSRSTLYYELRLKGQPINPARQISGLGS